MSAAPPKCKGLCGVIFIPSEAGCGMSFVGVWVGGGHRKNAEVGDQPGTTTRFSHVFFVLSVSFIPVPP